jgi:hypothetical protein
MKSFFVVDNQDGPIGKIYSHLFMRPWPEEWKP